MLPSCTNNSVLACFHAFHYVGLCCTEHSHILLRMLCLCPFSTHGPNYFRLLSVMSDVKNTWRYTLHLLIYRISAGLNIPDAVIVSMIELTFSLPCVGFHIPATFTVASHLATCAQIAVIQFLSMMAPAYCLYDCSNVLTVEPLSICLNSIIMQVSCPVVSCHLRCPSRYCSWPWFCTAVRWSISIPPYLFVTNTTVLGALLVMPIFVNMAFTTGFVDRHTL
jgi:hypothetical protein